MGVYDNRSRRSRDDDLELIIKDRLTTVTRERKVHADQMRAPTTETAGPYSVRIEQFRATRNATTFDEKGSNATAAYVLVALNRPELGDTWAIPKTISNEKTFKVNDLLTDADGNVYRVTSPARWDGSSLELNIELLG